jgi:hypothetical protein
LVRDNLLYSQIRKTIGELSELQISENAKKFQENNLLITQNLTKYKNLKTKILVKKFNP